MMRTQRAFTLIELLIVVAIIAILAAIAVPNFLEAQVRSKVSRTHSDMRSIAAALEMYFVDYTSYPAPLWNGAEHRFGAYACLSTPIAYLTSEFVDPFIPTRTATPGLAIAGYEYGAGKAGQHASRNWDASGGSVWRFPNDTWLLESTGPDLVEDTLGELRTLSYPWVQFGQKPNAIAPLVGLIYDPSNGTRSAGQIFRTGGAPPGCPAVGLFASITKGQ